MIPILYFHGFASSPASAKITALRPLLDDAIELITPDLNVPSFEQLDYDAMVALAVDTAHRTSPRAIVGSSLGAIVALEVAARGTNAPLVLIAPALGVADRWKERLPAGDPIVVFNHARAGDVPIHRRFFEQIAEVRVDADAPRSRVTVLMGRKDETVPFDCVERVWSSWRDSGRLAAGSRFIELEEGDHSLVNHTAMIADVIRDTAASG